MNALSARAEFLFSSLKVLVRLVILTRTHPLVFEGHKVDVILTGRNRAKGSDMNLVIQTWANRFAKLLNSPSPRQGFALVSVGVNSKLAKFFDLFLAHFRRINAVSPEHGLTRAICASDACCCDRLFFCSHLGFLHQSGERND